MNANKMTQEYLKSILRYDPELGRFFWIVACGTRGTVGSKAGTLDPGGYRYIEIDKKRFMEHRLVWLYVYGVMPEDQLDHINHIRDDNRIKNLREVSHQENQRNRSMQKDNTSGVTGVNWHKSNSKWQVRINDKGKFNYIGIFEDYFDACCARKSAELNFGYHENHGRNYE